MRQQALNNSYLTHDFVSSQRRAGASDEQIANIIAKHNPTFASQLDNVRVRASRFSNGNDAIGAFLNYSVYGDATYKPIATEAPEQFSMSKGFSARNMAESNPAMAPFKALYNTAPSAVNMVKGLAGAARHPGKTIAGIANAAVGGAENVYEGITGKQAPQFNPDGTVSYPEQTQGQEAIGNIAGHFVDRYGSISKAAETAAEDPVGAYYDFAVGKPKKAIVEPLTDAQRMVGRAGRALEETAQAAKQQEKVKFAQKLVTPELNKRGMIDEVDSFREIKEGGIIKEREIVPTKREIEVAETVAKIPEIDSTKTALQNRDAINTQITRVAKDLDEAFLTSDPVFSNKELAARLKQAKQKQTSKIIFASDAQAEKLYDALTEALMSRVKGKKKTSSLWEARKEFDVDVQNQGVNFDKVNLKTELAELVRETVNIYIEDQMQRTGHTFLPEMREMNNLYIARKNVAPKAAMEASTAVGRWVQAVQKRTRLSKGTLVALSSAGIVGGALTGVLQAGAIPALFAMGTYKFGRFMFSPRVRIALGRALRTLEEGLSSLPIEEQFERRMLIREGNALIRGEIPPLE